MLTFYVYFGVSEKLKFELNFLWFQLLNRLLEVRILQKTVIHVKKKRCNNNNSEFIEIMSGMQF